MANITLPTGKSPSFSIRVLHNFYTVALLTAPGIGFCECSMLYSKIWAKNRPSRWHTGCTESRIACLEAHAPEAAGPEGAMLLRKGPEHMAAAWKDPISDSGSLAEEVIDTIRSEPALAWFLAQALWISQPALEAFWPQEKIAALAERLETKTNPDPGGGAVRGRGESENRK
jgi:hypothetical protein